MAISAAAAAAAAATAAAAAAADDDDDDDDNDDDDHDDDDDDDDDDDQDEDEDGAEEVTRARAAVGCCSQPIPLLPITPFTPALLLLRYPARVETFAARPSTPTPPGRHPASTPACATADTPEGAPLACRSCSSAEEARASACSRCPRSRAASRSDWLQGGGV